MPVLTVIIGSTRPGRAALPIARWFTEQATQHGGFDVRVADLTDINLPLMNEAKHPVFRQYEHEHTIRWSEIVATSDAFVIVSPEYNHGYSAVIKNALDYLMVEWAYKPVGFVSYGGVAGGTRAVAQLKPVVTQLRMTPVSDTIIIPNHTQMIDEAGTFQSNDILNFSALGMLNEIAKLEGALRPIR